MCKCMYIDKQRVKGQNLKKSGLSFHHVGPRAQTRLSLVMFGGRDLSVL